MVRAEGMPSPAAAPASAWITPAALWSWAEANFPQWFAGPAVEAVPEAGVLLRQYPGTGVAVTLRGVELSVQGGPFGTTPVPVGTLDDLACDVLGPQCPVPQIVGEPSDRIRFAGAPVTWEVAARGPSLRYQWWRDGQPIPGATWRALAVTAGPEWEGALVQVRVSNARGEATSAPVSLVLRRPPDLARAVAVAQAQACTACHAVDVQGAGPPWLAIAAAYAGRADGAEAIALSVARGSSGTWSAVMPAYPGLDLATRALIADAVLSLAPQAAAAASGPRRARY